MREQEISPARLKAQQAQLERENGPVIHVTEIEDLRRTPVTVRDDFHMPEEVCKCGGEMYPVAFNDCGDISCFMMCDDCGDCGKEIPWPFNEARAWREDFEKIGFVYEW